MSSPRDAAARDNADLAGAPVPPENEPGQRPEADQDKPLGERPRPSSVIDRFGFRFAGPVGAAARALVLREERACVEVGDGLFVARYGPWTVTTPLDNVAGTSRTGPYRWWKVMGPPHISLRDRGLTFATNTEDGVCIRFHEPVGGIEPTGRLRHPALTVTVADVAGLTQALAREQR